MTKLLCTLAIATVATGLWPVHADDKTIRDETGRIIATISDTANGRTVRDSDGKIIGRIEDSATGRVVRDENGKIIGRISTTKDTKDTKQGNYSQSYPCTVARGCGAGSATAW